MILIPRDPVPFPVLAGPADLVTPTAPDERLAVVTAYQTAGPIAQHAELGPDGQAFFEVDGPDGPVRCETKPGITWVHIRGLGRRARSRLADDAGPANILGEQIAARLKNRDEVTKHLHADAATLVDTFIGRDVMKQSAQPWRLVLEHAGDQPDGMARDALVRQLTFAVALMVRLPGAYAARHRLEAAGADTTLLDELLVPITINDLDDTERAAFDAHVRRAERIEDAMIRAALAAIVVGGARFEDHEAIDVLDRAPVPVAELLRAQVIGHAHRLSMSGKAPPPSGRQSG